MEKHNQSYFLTKEELTNIIILIYKEKNNSFPTKLVFLKIFYFAFAYSSSKIKKTKTIIDGLGGQIASIPYFDYICDPKTVKFVARGYGAVEIDLYKNFETIYKDNEFKDNNVDKLFGTKNNNDFDKFLIKYIKDIVEEYSLINPFSLIDIAQTDDCWKKNYKTHSVIENEDILNEYYEKHQNQEIKEQKWMK